MKKFVCAVLILMSFLAVHAAAAEKIRVGVMPFQTSVADVGTYQAASIGDFFTQMFGTTEGVSVLGREQLTSIANENKLAISGYISNETAVEVGKLADCRYVVVGIVTDFSRKASSSGVWIAGSHKEEAYAAADVKVIDVETGRVIMTTSETGHASQSGSYVVIYGISSGQSELSGMDAGAIAELASKLDLRVREAITGDTVRVAEKTAKNVKFNLGTLTGSRKDALYRIYVGSGSSEKNLAVVKVTDAKSEYSIAVPEKSAGNFALVRAGDKIFPVNSEELKDLKKRKAFAKTRPQDDETSSGKIEDLLKSSGSSSSSTSTPAALRPETKSETATSERKFENKSTDPAKVVAGYGLSAGETAALKAAHTNAQKLGNKSKRAYEKYVELANSNEIDYLAAYRAGVLAKNLGKKQEAAEWFAKALEINPDYEPAKKELKKK